MNKWQGTLTQIQPSRTPYVHVLTQIQPSRTPYVHVFTQIQPSCTPYVHVLTQIQPSCTPYVHVFTPIQPSCTPYVHVLTQIQATAYVLYTNDTTTFLLCHTMHTYKQMCISCVVAQATCSNDAVPARTDQIEPTGVRVREEINAKHTADCMQCIYIGS